MPSEIPSERSIAGRIAAHTRWAQVEDPTEATRPAREAFLARFERQADPDGSLSPTERRRRAQHLRSAYFARLALKSAKARRKARGAA